MSNLSTLGIGVEIQLADLRRAGKATCATYGNGPRYVSTGRGGGLERLVCGKVHWLGLE
jgi:hypothetical protein